MHISPYELIDIPEDQWLNIRKTLLQMEELVHTNLSMPISRQNVTKNRRDPNTGGRIKHYVMEAYHEFFKILITWK